MSSKVLLTRLTLLAALSLAATSPGLDEATGDMLAALGAVPKPNIITVIASDFAFDMPQSMPAGLTTFELRNHGKVQHHLSIVRLDSGKTAADGLAALIKVGQGVRPAWMHSVGGPNAPMPGESSNATLMLEPGDYFAFCEVIGPDPAHHYMKGMVKGFSVAPPSKPSALPSADLSIDLVDYDFVLSHELTRGNHVIEVTNSSTQPHMMVIKRFPIDYSAERAKGELVAWAADPKGEIGPEGAGGVTEIAPGNVVVMQRDFTPGMYLLVCFSADGTDGKPHFKHGMSKAIYIR